MTDEEKKEKKPPKWHPEKMDEDEVAEAFDTYVRNPRAQGETLRAIVVGFDRRLRALEKKKR